MLKKLTGLLALISISTIISAQAEEALSPITGNPILKFIKNEQPTFIRKTGIKDTLLLPFFDDFSKGEVFPNVNKWTDRHAYVNTDFAIKPPTVGVATLDGLDSTGRPYLNIRADLFGPCDTLTSQPINISAYNATNNIYLSFSYQPQGLSFYKPAPNDSLVLQFKTSQGFWYTAWSTRNANSNRFISAIVKVDSLPYFHAGFQFRFINYQNYFGGIGQWHLDYVYLERNRNPGDTIFKDVAITQKPNSILKNYQEMPYHQFVGFETAEKIDTAWGSIGNRDTIGRTLDLLVRVVKDDSANIISNSNRGGLALDKLSDTAYYFNETPIFKALNADSCIFTVSENLKITGANFRTDNDSFARKLTFGNYYAYDDGTAETGYGLRNGTGKVAYRFKLNKPDSLRAISVYYFQAEDTVKKAFNLSVWQELAMNGGTEKLVYSKILAYPTYTDSINGYHTYILDSALAVSGEFYIGWSQSSIFHLNVGWDRNYKLNNQAIANPNLFFNSTGKWVTSFIPGTLMMRPHLGKNFIKDTTLLSVNQPIAINNHSLLVYPNPANETLNIQLPTEENYTYTVLDITGKIALQGQLFMGQENSLNISPLTNGIYFIILHHPTQGNYRTKFIKQ